MTEPPSASAGDGGARRRYLARQPPVHDLDLAERADHDVRRLQVAVDHAARVGVGEVWQITSKRRRTRCSSWADWPRSANRPREGAALDQLHGDERRAVGHRSDLVDRHDAGVLEPAADAGLPRNIATRSGWSAHSGLRTLMARSRPRSGSCPR